MNIEIFIGTRKNVCKHVIIGLGRASGNKKIDYKIITIKQNRIFGITIL